MNEPLPPCSQPGQQSTGVFAGRSAMLHDDIATAPVMETWSCPQIVAHHHTRPYTRQIHPPAPNAKREPPVGLADSKSKIYRCGYCGCSKRSNTASNGIVRIRCVCGGQYADGVIRMHSRWYPIFPTNEPTPGPAWVSEVFDSKPKTLLIQPLSNEQSESEQAWRDLKYFLTAGPDALSHMDQSFSVGDSIDLVDSTSVGDQRGQKRQIERRELTLELDSSHIFSRPHKVVRHFSSSDSSDHEAAQ